MVSKPLVMVAGLPTATQLTDTDIAGTTAGAIPFVAAGALAENATGLFWDNTNGFFGVGNGAPAANIHVVSIVSTTSCVIWDRYTTNTNSPQMDFRKARGTPASPVAVLKNDFPGNFRMFGYGGSTFIQCAGFTFRIIEPTPSQTAMGAQFTLTLKPISQNVVPQETLRAEFDTGLSMFGANPVIDQNRVFRLRPYTVATLPAGVDGSLAFVTDALTPAALTLVVAGGIRHTPVFYDGGLAQWTVV